MKFILNGYIILYLSLVLIQRNNYWSYFFAYFSKCECVVYILKINYAKIYLYFSPESVAPCRGDDGHVVGLVVGDSRDGNPG